MALEGYKLIKEETLRDIADAIREKTGVSTTIVVTDFAFLIRRIKGTQGGLNVIHVGDHWVEEENVNDYTVTTTGELEAYEDSAGWEVDATGIGYGTVTVTRKLDGEVVRQTEYIIIA